MKESEVGMAKEEEVMLAMAGRLLDRVTNRDKEGMRALLMPAGCAIQSAITR